MRVINVVKIKDGVVDDITSFGVFEEQLVQDVVDLAEADFLQKAKELGFQGDEEEEEELKGEACYECDYQFATSVCLSWSDI
jgi:hypothetical protein